MSVLKRAAGIQAPNWATLLANSFPAPTNDDGYNGPWGQGMVWHGPGRSPLTTSDASMRLSAVFGCLRILSESIATMPIEAQRLTLGVMRPASLPAYLQFNPPQGSRIDYLSQVMLSLLTAGNAYILTPRDDLGEVLDLIVLDPHLMVVNRIEGKVTYRCQNIELDPFYDVLHIKGMCMPGRITGLSPLGYARESSRLGLSSQEFGAAFVENGAVSSGHIEVEQDVDRETAKRVLGIYNETHQGASNAGLVGVLTGGAKFVGATIKPIDFQFLETRQFQVSDIARFFGVFPHLLNDASQSTSWGSGLAELNLAFGQYGLRPWVERIDEGHSRLETTAGRPKSFIRLDMDGQLRADRKERYEAYQMGVEARIITINEVRAEEGLPAVPWGDEPFINERITVTAPGTPPVDAPAAPPAPDVDDTDSGDAA